MKSTQQLNAILFYNLIVISVLKLVQAIQKDIESESNRVNKAI